MGSSSSKFRKHLQTGDEYAALQLFNSNADLRKALDPNSSYGDTYNHDSPMHYAARHAMKALLRIFLYELGGNPNKKNARNETALHCVCLTSVSCRTYALQQRRLECLMLILQWRGPKMANGEYERVSLDTPDEKQNTALHYAAASGLKRCVELLVSKNASLFCENAQKQTPCDCAEKCGHGAIALYLESKMVFSNVEGNKEDDDILLDQIEADEAYSGLRAQDLQEAKDQLLVETADMLHVPLFTAEALLRHHEWSREMLLEAWMWDAIACCEKCGVVPPSSIYKDQAIPPAQAPDPCILPPPPASPHDVPQHEEIICDICACLIGASEEPVSMTCDHEFCRNCWGRYLTGKIQEGDAHNITCPGYQCSKLVPVEVIETLVSRDMARRYLQFDIKAFVESNPHIKWCPHPGCGQAVKLPDSENPLSPTFRDPNSGTTSTSDFSHAVDCGNGHLFCWECLGEPHEPSSCDHWNNWHKDIQRINPEDMSGTDEETELAANCLWLVTNSKACPNCKSPIQKNEGCNHMKCSKCKHDFCWVCLEAWKKHSSATGGYFRCNRYEVVKKVEEGTDRLRSDAESRNKRMQELNKFLHYYTRFKNHENSYKLEMPLLSTAKEKMLVLARAVSDPEAANSETKFVEDAVHQLLKARRILKCSYVYGFYLEDTGYKKPIFEFMQTELEECTEALSEMVARPYLRTPRHKIIQTARLVQRKRHELLTAISKGLIPPDNSPNLRKKKNRFGADLDDDLKKALLASIQDLEPGTTWVKDPSGRHTNITAVLDWPEDSEDSDSENVNPNMQPPMGIATCTRKDCQRPRAQNPRTGEYHDHCSLRCMRADFTEEKEPEVESPTPYFNDYEMELLRALEMSRLQFLREMGQLRPGSGDSSRSPRTPGRSPGGEPMPRSSNDDESPDSPLQLQEPPKGHSPCVSLCHSPPPPPEPLQLHHEPPVARTAAGEDDCDLRLAIELSLRDSMTSETGSLSALPSVPLPPPPPHFLSAQSSPYSDQYSSIVTRVPNKSVEDLVLESAQCERPMHDMLGAVGGLHGNGQKPFPNAAGDGQLAEQLHVPNTFGTIKDINVTNLVLGEKDKTKDFEKKDFSQFYAKSADVPMESVFEPRPCLGEMQSLAKKLHLTPTGGSQGRRQDVWLEQSVMGGRSRSPRDPQPYCPLGSQGRNPMDQPYCPLSSVSRSPKETCPLTSPFSRSPRETCPLASLSRSPRDRRSFSGQEFHSSGRNSPDLLQVAPPRRCTSWGDNSHISLGHDPLSHHSAAADTVSLDIAYDPSPFDDDDPGPRLDAVLRSLSKLTARLGDDDKDMFPNYDEHSHMSVARSDCTTQHSHGSVQSDSRPAGLHARGSGQVDSRSSGLQIDQRSHHGPHSNNTNPPHGSRHMHGTHSDSNHGSSCHGGGCHGNIYHNNLQSHSTVHGHSQPASQAHTIPNYDQHSSIAMQHPAPLPAAHGYHGNSQPRTNHSHHAEGRAPHGNRRASYHDTGNSEEEDAVFV